MNCPGSRGSPIQLLVYQINAWFLMNMTGNKNEINQPVVSVTDLGEGPGQPA